MDGSIHQYRDYKYKIFSGWLDIEDVGIFLDHIRKISRDTGIEIVIIDADYIVSLDNLIYAVMKAIDSWIEKRNVAKTLSMEVLLYVSATRQIKDAIRVGVKEGRNRVYLVLIGSNTDLEKIGRESEIIPRFTPEKFDINLDSINLRKIMEMYDIDGDELRIVGLDKLDMLIRERMVLFELNK
jgi:KEOPS complex subunit Cgi121